MNEAQKIRSLFAVDKLNQSTNENRSLFESIIATEVISAIEDWITSSSSLGVLIGGLALSYYVKPRYTMDVDLIFLSDSEIPEFVTGFKKTRSHAFQHNKTHVEVEVLTPKFLDVDRGLIKKVIEKSGEESNIEISSGINIASKSGLVALKLQRVVKKLDTEYKDRDDILSLVRSGGVSLRNYRKWITPEQRKIYNELKSRIEG